MSKTTDHLKEAFAGESQAHRKYLLFAEAAEKDGQPQIAKLFRAAATAEAIHAANHFKALGGIGTTAQNLQTAIDGEHYEVVSMYPGMVAEAETAGIKKALTSFTWAMEAEKGHEQLYRKALENLEKGQASLDYYVCPFCGYTHEGPMTEKCPVCGTPAEKFIRVA
ncbi:MAG: rubrerythrin family protein [Anaerolineales bacterium]